MLSLDLHYPQPISLRLFVNRDNMKIATRTMYRLYNSIPTEEEENLWWSDLSIIDINVIKVSKIIRPWDTWSNHFTHLNEQIQPAEQWYNQLLSIHPLWWQETNKNKLAVFWLVLWSNYIYNCPTHTGFSFYAFYDSFFFSCSNCLETLIFPVAISRLVHWC